MKKRTRKKVRPLPANVKPESPTVVVNDANCCGAISPELTTLDRSAKELTQLRRNIEDSRQRLAYLEEQLATEKSHLSALFLNHQAECFKMQQLATIPQQVP